MQAHTCRDTQKLQDTVGSVTSAARQDKTGKMESIEGEERKGEERRGKERRREEERGEEGGVALKSFRCPPTGGSRGAATVLSWGLLNEGRALAPFPPPFRSKPTTPT